MDTKIGLHEKSVIVDIVGLGNIGKFHLGKKLWAIFVICRE
jgi:hypothetical protein